MIYLSLRQMFEKRAILNPYAFLQDHGFKPHTIRRILNNDYTHLHLDHLEMLCGLLHCTPNDLLAWNGSSKHVTTANHPLTALKRNANPIRLSQMLSNIPLDKVDEFWHYAEQLSQGEKEKSE